MKSSTGAIKIEKYGEDNEIREINNNNNNNNNKSHGGKIKRKRQKIDVDCRVIRVISRSLVRWL